MDLREYIFYNRIKVKDLCKELGVSASHLSLLRNAKGRPSYRLAKDICKYTGGEVSIEHLMSLPKQVKLKEVSQE